MIVVYGVSSSRMSFARLCVWSRRALDSDETRCYSRRDTWALQCARHAVDRSRRGKEREKAALDVAGKMLAQVQSVVPAGEIREDKTGRSMVAVRGNGGLVYQPHIYFQGKSLSVTVLVIEATVRSRPHGNIDWGFKSRSTHAFAHRPKYDKAPRLRRQLSCLQQRVSLLLARSIYTSQRQPFSKNFSSLPFSYPSTPET
ncbi:uncharacterized protein F5Z01DRAFT_34739 [Emericellopsis atlantica]|uniref:Uncharacterized protein n=1 Tax=Emericellopsis atlantica TaxID=2614577 RepID=A0A9P8CTL2_9HYPO|nr:uncharacterized protein F5Z01DRAFT_34739 [Emericellopsis atlantica]KAG9259289.1 hypothetical protein F5Z01DRAFT_34739 [Emericellopsis atlantica]